ncbi:MAG: hypothetical protein JW876_03150 [Candidatus Krumholzibacteriota bacterium]|nr:hypothetical protein [Candidatus Krumholzibacteriota bacterium]
MAEKRHTLSWLMTALLIVFLLTLSCSEDEKVVEVPVATDCPPSAPTGVYAVNYDGLVTICWTANEVAFVEDDIDGYDIWQGEEMYGEYLYIGTVYAHPDSFYYCFDWDTENGEQYWYAVSAFDEAGLESPLSYDDVSATPRPEGYLTLMDHLATPLASGYDFSTLSNMAQGGDFATSDADIRFSVEGGVRLFTVDMPHAMIQDYGYGDFDVINFAPDAGWNLSGSVEVTRDHVYILRIGEPDGFHYVKLFVAEIDDSRAGFWWAYQTDADNRDLSPRPGDGVRDGGDAVPTPIVRVRIKTKFHGSTVPPSLREGNETQQETSRSRAPFNKLAP